MESLFTAEYLSGKFIEHEGSDAKSVNSIFSGVFGKHSLETPQNKT